METMRLRVIVDNMIKFRCSAYLIMNLQITYDSNGSYLTIIWQCHQWIKSYRFILSNGATKISANTVCFLYHTNNISQKHRLMYKDITLLWLDKVDLSISSGLFHHVIAPVQLKNSERYRLINHMNMPRLWYDQTNEITKPWVYFIGYSVYRKWWSFTVYWYKLTRKAAF